MKNKWNRLDIYPKDKREVLTSKAGKPMSLDVTHGKDFRHRGMIGKALQKGIITANWRELLWE